MENKRSIKIKCPTCKKLIDYNKSANRPFCSERCKIKDLANWGSGHYKITKNLTDDDEIVN